MCYAVQWLAVWIKDFKMFVFSSPLAHPPLSLSLSISGLAQAQLPYNPFHQLAAQMEQQGQRLAAARYGSEAVAAVLMR